MRYTWALFRDALRNPKYFFPLILFFFIIIPSSLKSHIHWEIFYSSTRALFEGHQIYGILRPQENGQTLWLYSPSAAYFFFSLFAWMPKSLGLFFYLSSSLGIFLWGLQRFAKSFQIEAVLHSWLFWVLACGEVIGSLQAAKVELISTGFLMIALSACASRSSLLVGSFALALLASLKFQGLPLLGLLCIVALQDRFVRRMTATALIGTVIYTLAGFALLADAQQTRILWIESMQWMLERTWSTYQSFPALLKQYFAWPQDLKSAQHLVIFAALFFAGVLGRRVLKNKGTPKLLCANTALLGVAYIVLFSLASQSSGYVFWTPCLLLWFHLSQVSKNLASWPALTGLGCWACVSLFGSSLVPELIVLLSRSYQLKTAGASVFFVLLYVLLNHKRDGSFHTAKGPNLV
jgi:hypothetical protein